MTSKPTSVDVSIKWTQYRTYRVTPEILGRTKVFSLVQFLKSPRPTSFLSFCLCSYLLFLIKIKFKGRVSITLCHSPDINIYIYLREVVHLLIYLVSCRCGIFMISCYFSFLGDNMGRSTYLEFRIRLLLSGRVTY